MMWLKLAFVFHVAAIFAPIPCASEKSQKNEFANPGKIFSEMETAMAAGGGEFAIEKNMESLKRIVKRVAPEQNGEYQVYQGVSGQPGVDFPALTSIPATSFTCRGMKGGYYADLETNCQVFHICDNSRKISFLCPNGTIFQQSQLICDWWFKVECSKSAEFYEQSSEQLADEERKRTEKRRNKNNYNNNGDRENSRDYYDVQSLDYDGKQNARINPTYDDESQSNRLKSNRQFENRDPLHSEAKQFHGTKTDTTNYRHSTLHRTNSRPDDYDDTNRYTTVTPEFRNDKRVQNYQTLPRNTNPREEKVPLKRQKYKNVSRPPNNPTNILTSSNPPRYTESTTFRASTTQAPKESQQFAESAAFVSNRGSRFNDGSGPQFYYQLYPNQQADANYNGNEQASKGNIDGKGDGQYSDHSEPTTASPDLGSYETTGHYWTTTTTPSPPCHTDHPDIDVSYTVTPDPLNPTTPTSAFGTRESKSQKFSYTATTDGHRIPEYTTSTPTTYSETTSYYQYTDNRVTETEVPTTDNPDDYKSTNYPQTEQAGFTESSNKDYYTVTEATSQGLRNNNDRSTSGSSSSSSFAKSEVNHYTSSVSEQYRQTIESLDRSTEKPVKSTFPYKPYTLSEKNLSPYDTSFTYKQGKVMSTLGPYVPFTKTYPAYTTLKPSSESVSNQTSDTNSSLKSLIPKLKQSSNPNSLGKSKDHFGGLGYLPEKEHALGMLNSLKNLVEESEPSNTSAKVSYNSGAPGSSTLHSLALYFSTATDSFDSGETTDSSSPEDIEIENHENEKLKESEKKAEQIPTGLLTQHTITSYAELFKLNNALENNVTEDRPTGYDPEDYSEDLDVHQSSASLEDQERSNGTKLRELAQVFTHALSAYLLDPDAFKKVLTEIRPTEPPTTTETTDDWLSTTTSYPTTLEDDTSISREKDEVLDFSEADNELARLQVTNTYSPINTVPSTLPETTATDQQDASTLPTEFRSPTTKVTTPKVTPTRPPIIKEDVSSRNRVGGFQNNTQVTPQARSKNFGGSHRENYVSSTPAPRSHYSSSYGWTSKKPEQQLTPPFYENNVRSKDEVVKPPQNREAKRHEYPHFLVPPFSSTSSSSIHRGRGINFVINKNEQPPIPSTSKLDPPTSSPSKHFEAPTYSTTSSSSVHRGRGINFNKNEQSSIPSEIERSTPSPNKNFEAPGFIPSKHFEPPPSTAEPSKHYEPPHLTSTTRAFEAPSSTIAPLKLVEEPPSFVPSRHYEPPPHEQNYNRVRFFKASQLAPNENDETLVTARTEYAKFRNYNRLDTTGVNTEKVSGSTIGSSVTSGSTVNPSTTTRSKIRPTTPRPTDPISRLTESTSTKGTTEASISETTISPVGRESVTQGNKASTPGNGGLTNDHWTSSPAVTRLWETSVFIDPKRINQGLASETIVPSTTEVGTTQRSIRGHGDATHEAEFGDSSEDIGEQSVDVLKDDSNWGWVSKDKDSPTAFTLLPASYSFESTGTPKPVITTRSSITTTITSSVTSTNALPQENLLSSLQPYSQIPKRSSQVNSTETDVAHKLFGKLNATSTSTLMKVMRQADKNETVRQLVLLLVSYCRDPANDTMEQEKDNLLDALLRMPVNEFTSAESRNVVSNFDKATIPNVRSRIFRNNTRSSTPAPRSGMLAQASSYSGFRERKARRYRTTTEGSNDFDRREKLQATDDNNLQDSETKLADNRALELLRSLYSIANKWA